MLLIREVIIIDKDYLNRELGTFEILKISRFIYTKNIKYMMLIALIFYLPMVIVMTLIPQYLIQAVIKLSGLMSQASGMDAASSELFINSIDPGLLRDNFIFMSLVFGILAFFTPLAAGAATYITKQTLQGKAIELSGMLDASVGKAGKHLFTSVILYYLLFFSAALIVPYIVLYVFFYFSQNVVADEGKWGIAAFKKSYDIVKGRWFKTLSFVLIILFLTLIVNYIFLFGDSIILIIILFTLGQYFGLWFVVAAGVKYFNLSSLKSLKEEKEN